MRPNISALVEIIAETLHSTHSTCTARPSTSFSFGLSFDGGGWTVVDLDAGGFVERLVHHVLIHEVGHHFGLSDADMHALEDEAG